MASRCREPSIDTRLDRELIPALAQSSCGIIRLLTLGCERGGTIPVSSLYTWRNLPLDVGHVLTYFVAHEGHHRRQIVMLARQLGYRLPLRLRVDFGNGRSMPKRLAARVRREVMNKLETGVKSASRRKVKKVAVRMA